jgi:hypothetical protein
MWTVRWRRAVRTNFLSHVAQRHDSCTHKSALWIHNNTTSTDARTIADVTRRTKEAGNQQKIAVAQIYC